MYGTFAPGSESTWERKFLLPYRDTDIEGFCACIRLSTLLITA